MESMIRFFFLDDISPATNESDPNRMGARMIAFLVNSGSSPLRSMMFMINNRMALDPTSIAAYFLTFKIELVFVVVIHIDLGSALFRTGFFIGIGLFAI